MIQDENSALAGVEGMAQDANSSMISMEMPKGAADKDRIEADGVSETSAALVLSKSVARIGYADPPYIGCAHLYKDHPDYAGEVDHTALIMRLNNEFDGWILHAAATAKSMAILAPLAEEMGARWMAWVKPFAAFKRNVPVAYAWEPVLVKPARKPVVSKRLIMRDWLAEGITLKRGLTGAKPEAVCHWLFEVVGACPGDCLVDMFPGTGAVSRAWRTWEAKFLLPASPEAKP